MMANGTNCLVVPRVLVNFLAAYSLVESASCAGISNMICGREIASYHTHSLNRDEKVIGS